MKRLALAFLAAAVLACGGTPAWADVPPGEGDEPVLTADTQPGYQGQTTCSPAPKPGAVALLGLLQQRWGGSSWGVSRGCEVGGRSEHKEGRALDWHMDAANPADRVRVADALNWLTANDGEVAERLGVMYVIWDQKVWASYRRAEGWRPMADRGSSTANHRDHVHVSLTWDGAMQQTSWWTGVPVAAPLAGPCGVAGAPDCRPLTAMAAQAILLDSPEEPIRPESLPAPAEVPLIGGTAQVGHLLQVVPGSWVPEGAELAFQWIGDGIPIPGANEPTHAVTASELDAVLRVRVMAFDPDGSVVIRLSDELPRVTPAPFRLRPEPTILGRPVVGRVLSVDPGSWRPFPATMAFQWYRNDRPVTGATGYSYDLTAADVGRRISVAVTATAAGFETPTVTSATTPLVEKAVLAAPVPTVDGERVQGRTLTAVPGRWGPSPVDLSYQWLREGRPVKGETKSTYTLTEADVGTTIRVRVRGSKPGYSAASATSAAGRAVRPEATPVPSTPPTPSPTPSTPSVSPTPQATAASPTPTTSPTVDVTPASTPAPIDGSTRPASSFGPLPSTGSSTGS